MAGFALESEEDGGEKLAATRKKYLVARNKEQANSIFDYVHLSSTLLRKVRFGQPIELAIQKPLKGAKTCKTKKLTNLSELSSSSPAQQQQQSSQFPQSLQSSSNNVRFRQSSASISARSPGSSNPPASSRQLPIRYGRVVRFQAADGGFLLVESDGCLRKVPADRASDPRTRITLFPRDPLTHLSKQQRHRRVHSGDWAFIVQGDGAALETELGIARANSDEMVEGPKYFVDAAARHDETATASVAACMPQQDDQQPHHRHLSKLAIRKKQLAQAFLQDTESMPPSVWCLTKVPPRTTHTLDTSADADEEDVCFRHGAQLQIFQNSFVVCYELQSSKDDGGGGSYNNSSSSSQRRTHSTALSPSPGSGNSSETSSSSDSQPSNASSPSSFGQPSASSSAFTHLWLQETLGFALSYHPTHCSCSSSDRRKAIWDNTWTICDVAASEENRSSSNTAAVSLPASSLELPQENARRRSKPSRAGAGDEEPSPGSIESSRREARTSRDETELDPLSEEDDEPEDEQQQQSLEAIPLQRQLSVFDVTTFSSKAETQRMRAARIIVRFFRRLYHSEVTQSRVRDFLRRRRRLTHTKKHGETELSTREQLKLLQCYNPNVYGSNVWPYKQQRSSVIAASTLTHDQGGFVSFDRFTNRAEADRQKLATMKCDVDFLNRDWLRTERHHSAQKATSASLEMYSRRSLSSPFTSKRILRNREREHHFHVEMKMARRDPPTFHYGALHAAVVSPVRRPRTAPLAVDVHGAPSP